MSAFIVGDSCFNRIVSYFASRHHEKQYVFRDDAGALSYDLAKHSEMQRLARDLYVMNCDAVDARYKSGTAAADLTKAGRGFRFTVDQVSNVVAFKCAQCLQYQCSEGDVPTTELFKLLERIKSAIAMDIIRVLPEYVNAGWGE